MSDRFYYIDPTGRQSGPFAQNDLVHFAKLGLVARDGRIELVGIDTQFIVADVPWLEHCIPADRTAPPLPPDARSAEPIAPEPTPFAYPHPAAALGAPPLPAAQPQLGATPTRDAFAAAATPGPDASAPLTQTARSTYLLLALLPAFVGIFGIHNIVAGYVGRGVFQLVLSLVTVCGCCIGLGAPPCLCLGLPLWLGMFVWTLVEALTVRSDARGRAFA